MKYVVPDYFHEFKCVAERCRDTCCAGWDIAVDDRTLEKYDHLKGGIRNRIKNSVDYANGTYYRSKGKCVLLSSEGLCDVYTEAGEEYMCAACRNYPRHKEIFYDTREATLSISCPEVARMILSREEKVQFKSYYNNKKKDNYDAATGWEEAIFAAREAIYAIIQNRELSIEVRQALVLGFAHDYQRRINQCKENNTLILQELEELISKYSSPKWAQKVEKYISGYRGHKTAAKRVIKTMIHVYDGMEQVDVKWKKALGYKGGYTQVQIEQLLIYWISVYFAGGIYDGDIYTKTRFALVNTLIMMQMAPEEVHHYAREVEHSQDNLEYLEKCIRKKPVFSAKNLLMCIMNQKLTQN